MLVGVLLLVMVGDARAVAAGGGCELRPALFGSKQVYTCTNVSSAYLAARVHQLNASDWFQCVGCALDTLGADALARFEPKNRILYLNVSGSRVARVADFAFARAPATGLKLLLLQANRLTRLTNATFASLRRLLQLDLSRNQLSELAAGAFAPLRALDILNLNANRVRVVRVGAFAGLAQLKYLYLSDNALAALPARAFADLPNLRILHLERNRLQRLGPLAFAGLRRLRYLYLNGNRVDALAAYAFKELAALVDLQLRANQLAAVAASAFNGLRRLQFLYLGDNRIATLAAHAFAGLDALTVLELAGNQLDAFALDALDEMPQLRGLWLARNAIASVDAAAARAHRNLASLDLAHNRLDFFNYKLLLAKLACLEEVYVAANRFRCEFFVPMHDYFEDANVTLCVDAACDRNATVWHAEALCRLSYNHSAEAGLSHAEPQPTRSTTTLFTVIWLHLARSLHCLYQ